MLSIFVFGANQRDIPKEILAVSGSITCESEYSDKILEPLEPTPGMILCYPTQDSAFTTLEVAQTLRMNYPDIPIFFLATEKSDFDKKRLIKNGFSQAYLLPWEKADFLRALKDESIYSVIPELREYQAIKAVDLTPGTVLDFSLKAFLPRNNKLVSFCTEGDQISEEKISKLLEAQMSTVFVHKDDFEKFRTYTEENFKRLLRKEKMSETEKHEKLEKSVRDLLSDLFIEDTKENTFGKSQALLTNVKDMIKTLIATDGTDIDQKLESLVNQEGSFYLHLTNVAAYAGLFAKLLDFEKPEDLALAGILHDIGKINLPVDVAELHEREMDPEAMEAFRKHPNYTIEIIKQKRIVIPDSVMKGILHHHEAMNGSGYPSGLSGPRISKEGRILAIANAFDDLTCLKAGSKSLNPQEAVLKLIENNSLDPGRMSLDLEMLKTIKTKLIK